MGKFTIFGKLTRRDFIRNKINGSSERELYKYCVNPALLIDHILENVFSNLSTDDLKGVRLVCKQWDRAATRTMQKRPSVVIVCRKYNFWRMEEKCRQLIKQLKTFAGQDEFESSSYPIPGPYVRFKLCHDIWEEHESTLKKFFQVFHPYLVHLHVEIQQDSSLISLCDYFKTIRLPRLRTLIFDSSENVEKFVKKNRDELVIAFLSGSPRLQEIGLIFPKFKESPQAETDRIVTNFLRSICSRNIRNIILSVNVSDHLLATLTDLKFQLTHLQLFLQSSKLSSQLSKLLKAQQATLKTLKLLDIREGCEFELELDKMIHLQKLHIRGWHDSLRNVRFSTVSYKKDLPMLKNLHLDVPCGIPGNGFAWLDSFIPVHTAEDQTMNHSSNSVETLRLPTGFNCVHFAKRIPSLFPFLSCLEITLTPFSMASPIFEHLSECLRELKIFIQDFSFYVYADAFAPCRALDKLLTGVDLEAHDSLFSKIKLSDIDDLTLMRVRRKASLLSLKHLKKLQIKELDNRTIPLTDVTGYLAFLQMNNLRVLDVGQTLMRKDCLKKLAKRFPTNMTVHLNNCRSRGKYKEYVTIQTGCGSSISSSGCSVQ